MSPATFALKKRIVRLTCNSLVGWLLSRVLRDRLPHRGIAILSDHPSITASTKARLVFGLYESAETNFVDQYLPSDIDVIELGSSIGVVSSHIAKRIDVTRSLTCVEANPHLLGQIGRNILHNSPDTNFEVVNAAVDYSDSATVSLHVDTTNVGSHVVSDSGLGGSSVTVPSTTLGRLVSERDLDHYALVMDIEGAEYSLLHNEYETLAGCDLVIAELHDTGPAAGSQKPIETMVSLLETELGFRRLANRGRVYVYGR